MPGPFLIKLIAFYGMMVARSHCTATERCWNRTVYSDDVLVVCRLEENVSKTRHGVAVVPDNTDSDRLMVCSWNGQRCPKCHIHNSVHPLGDLTDILMIKVPAHKWQKDGSYKYQLIPPPDREDPYVPCEVIRTEARPQGGISVIEKTPLETTTSTIPNVTQQTTVEATMRRAEAYVSECEDKDSITGLLELAIVLLCLILVSIVGISIFAHVMWKRHMLKKAGGKSSSKMENGHYPGPLVLVEPTCEARNSLLIKTAEHPEPRTEG